ncbi:MAG: pirin family protein [Opitutaceae bacterium]
MNIVKQLTRSDERMHSKIDWLDSRHSFSFGGHYDPERMGFGPLRVVNDDWIAPKGGFPSHPHRDMEIISIVLDGQLEHKDSMGNGRVIQAGDIQYMSAGTGVTHSEFNPSAEESVHLMQIWIQPNAIGLEPRYEDQQLVGAQENQWSLLLSPDGRDDSMVIRQDVELRTVRLSSGVMIEYGAAVQGRGLWVFVVEGAVAVEGDQLEAGDSLALSGVESLNFTGVSEMPAKVLVFDVPL